MSRVSKWHRILAFLTFLWIGGDLGALHIVRDAEIEEVLTEIVKPIFKIAGLRPETARIYVINSEVVNAFTVGNGYIFITSELLLRFENPLQVIGILCHETGHIAAGHVERHISLLQKRSNNFIIAMLAGILGASLTGSADFMGLLLGYAATDERFYLKFSRGEELAADALAASYLEKLGYGSDVLIDALEVFRSIDLLNGGVNLPIYVLTHPKTDDRISALYKYAKRRKYKADENTSRKYDRVITKLRAYLKKPNLLAKTPEDDYSKAIYYHRAGKSKEAIALLRNLSKKNPLDLYQKEILAQVLYESGQLDESIKVYEQIYGKKVNDLIKIDYANVLIEADRNVDVAIRILESLKYFARFNSDIFRLLAKAYGKKGREGLAHLLLA
ncbi:MAG: M48 family metalloprotease, partial [Holosporaceae bacterium]|nr:M48 family metalloprotease [Holosporaceae bacterium]